jgi:hypothetical protein
MPPLRRLQSASIPLLLPLFPPIPPLLLTPGIGKKREGMGALRVIFGGSKMTKRLFR